MRLFFAFQATAPWPDQLPKGRIIAENERHLTTAFLGMVPYEKLEPFLSAIPLPSFKVGPSGNFDRLLFLPKANPRVVAWHISWDEDHSPLTEYIRTLCQWLRALGLHPDEREVFLPHVTLCRAPFNFHEWRAAFQKIPVFLDKLHLYKSLGQLHYEPIWTHQFFPPFEEMDHTADLAFKIYGINLEQLFWHAFNALAFKSPTLLKYKKKEKLFDSLDDIIMQLNEVIAYADAEEGIPFKAVSFHGEIESVQENVLTWEMIVDV